MKKNVSCLTSEEKGSIISFALVAILLFSSVLAISTLSILFLREITIKEKLNQVLRTAEGKIGLWTAVPGTPAYQAALDALISETAAVNIPGGSSSEVIKSELLNYAPGTKSWFAFLPPGECARLANGRLICNSHMCSLPPYPVDKTTEAPLCYACKTGSSTATGIFPCTAIPTGWHSCGASASSFCAQPTSSDSFLAKVEEFPIEIAAVIKTSLFGGIFKVERKVIVQGYPRVLNQEIVAAQIPTPVCGLWTESTSCPATPPCGDPALTYQLPRNWMCTTPPLGCRLPTDPTGVCGPSPGGSIGCPYQLCTTYACAPGSCPAGLTGSVQMCHRYDNGVDVGLAANNLCNSGAGCPNSCNCPEWTSTSCPTVTCPAGETQTGTETYSYTPTWSCPGGTCRPQGGTAAQCGSAAPGGTISCNRPICEPTTVNPTCRFAGFIPCPAGQTGRSGWNAECVSPTGTILPDSACGTSCVDWLPTCGSGACVPGSVSFIDVTYAGCTNGTCTSIAQNDGGCLNSLPKNCSMANGTPIVCEGSYYVNPFTCGQWCSGGQWTCTMFSPGPHQCIPRHGQLIFTGPAGVTGTCEDVYTTSCAYGFLTVTPGQVRQCVGHVGGNWLRDYVCSSCADTTPVCAIDPANVCRDISVSPCPAGTSGTPGVTRQCGKWLTPTIWQSYPLDRCNSCASTPRSCS